MVDDASLPAFEQYEIIKLRKLNRGYYDILSISTTVSVNEYPRLLINNGGQLCTVYCNQSLREQINSCMPTDSSSTKIATLIVYCHKRKASGDYVSDVRINFI